MREDEKGIGVQPQVPAALEQGHTPGPWRVHPYEINVGPYNKGRDVGPAGRSVAQVIGEFEKSTPGAEAEANARLIAAAPDLLEALELLAKQLRKRECSIADCKALDVSDAAITKATTL